MEKKSEMKSTRVTLDLSMKSSLVTLPESNISRVEEQKLVYRELRSKCKVEK